MNIVKFIGFMVLVLFATDGWGQKKVMGMPLAFKQPIDYSDFADGEGRMKQFVSEASTKAKDKKEPWLVFSDRDENPAYNAVNGKKIKTVDFREPLYVVEEKGEWVKVVSAQVDFLKILNLKEEIGWMPKKNLLLWNNGLVQEGSGIHKKVLLLNRADDITNVIASKNKTIVDVFKGPSTTSKEPDLRIFDFYFLVKTDPERGMYLLSREAHISNWNYNKALIGWVAARRCSKWNNRVCLEPNFDPSAFNQRKENPQAFGLRAFKDIFSAKEFVEGSGTLKNVYWEDDPIRLKPSQLSKENPRRFKGGVMRFPLLGSEEGKGGVEYFKSGLIGTIRFKKAGEGGDQVTSELSEAAYSEVRDQTKMVDYRTKNVNIFFIVEGTDSMYAFQNQIVEGINAANEEIADKIPNVHFGALVYRDIPEETVVIDGKKTNRLIEFQSLTPNVDKVTGFISNIEFQNKVDKDDWTSMYYGLSEALKNANFRESDLNIAIMIGCFGDFRIDKNRKEDAIRKKHKAYTDDTELNKIIENLSELNVHLYTIQAQRDGTSRPSKAYAAASEKILMDAAKYSYNTKGIGNPNDPKAKELLKVLTEKFNFPVIEPGITDLAEGSDRYLVGVVNPGRITVPKQGARYIPRETVTRLIVENVTTSVEFVQDVNSALSQLYDDAGKSLTDFPKIEAELNVDAGRLAPAVADILYQMIQEGNKKDILMTFDEKYKLFAEVIIPKTMKPGNLPAVSYCAFMPESELVEFLAVIKRLLAGGGGSYDERRRKLFEVHKELVAQLAGESGLRNKGPEDFTREELRDLLMGMQGAGLDMKVLHDFKIHDLRDEKKVSNDEIDALMFHYQKLADRLEGISRNADNYPYCYSTTSAEGNSGYRYYWIPIADLF